MNQPPMPPKKTKRWLRRLLAAFVVLLAVPLAYVAYTIHHANFHVIARGEAYRSGQMNTEQLALVIQKYGIKSIVNLRGANLHAGWYQPETNITQRLGVQRLDYGLSAGREVSDQEIEIILEFIRRTPKPVLIHCLGGADRTGLISALYLYTVRGKTPDAANRELTAFYGHIPHLHWRYSIAMDHSFWRYVSNHTAQPKVMLQPHPASP
jgi:protein tyrosine/serine phosphatase